MHVRILGLLLPLVLLAGLTRGSEEKSAKPTPEQALQKLKEGNGRFYVSATTNPHSDTARIKLAGTEKQANYAYATVLTCSDSRIPVERIFDAGVMDLFVVRTAGNVCSVTERASVEYGIMHVNTPVLVIMGHTQCGAVTAATQGILKTGSGHALERNIPPLLSLIHPAVQRALMGCPKNCTEADVIARSTEENVWLGIEALLLASPAIREQVQQNKVKIVGAIYDVGAGKVNWLPETTVYRILGRVEVDPRRETDAFGAGGHGDAAQAPGKADPHASPAVQVRSGVTDPHGKPAIKKPDGHQTESDSEPDAVIPPLRPNEKNTKTAQDGHGHAHGEEKEKEPAEATAPAGHGDAEHGDAGHGEKETKVAVAKTEKGKKGEKAEVKVNDDEHSKVAATSESALPGWVLYASGLIFVAGIGLMVAPKFLAKGAAAKAAHAPTAPPADAAAPHSATSHPAVSTPNAH